MAARRKRRDDIFIFIYIYIYLTPLEEKKFFLLFQSAGVGHNGHPGSSAAAWETRRRIDSPWIEVVDPAAVQHPIPTWYAHTRRLYLYMKRLLE